MKTIEDWLQVYIQAIYMNIYLHIMPRLIMLIPFQNIYLLYHIRAILGYNHLHCRIIKSVSLHLMVYIQKIFHRRDKHKYYFSSCGHRLRIVYRSWMGGFRTELGGYSKSFLRLYKGKDFIPLHMRYAFDVINLKFLFVLNSAFNYMYSVYVYKEMYD